MLKKRVTAITAYGCVCLSARVPALSEVSTKYNVSVSWNMCWDSVCKQTNIFQHSGDFQVNLHSPYSQNCPSFCFLIRNRRLNFERVFCCLAVALMSLPRYSIKSPLCHVVWDLPLLGQNVTVFVALSIGAIRYTWHFTIWIVFRGAAHVIDTHLEVSSVTHRYGELILPANARE